MTSALSLRWHRFSVLELLVIAVIVCVVAAIGLPTLHAQAKTSVLEMNLQSLAALVEEQAAEGYSTEYRESGQGSSARYLSTCLEASLGDSDNGGYVNPTASSANGHAVLNTSLPPTVPQATRPAILITNSPRYQYVFFNTIDKSARAAIAGTLIITFDESALSVEVFFVNATGKKSASVETIPLR